jgi:NTP pyrophosphatase (non-canonical NTP hydrolase)
LDNAESSKQYLKITEESGEVAAALARNDMHESKDGFGDVVVTLIILAQQNGMTLYECLYTVIGSVSQRINNRIVSSTRCYQMALVFGQMKKATYPKKIGRY